jgi:hypothetical protein
MLTTIKKMFPVSLLTWIAKPWICFLVGFLVAVGKVSLAGDLLTLRQGGK